jgi:hypothetical protein
MIVGPMGFGPENDCAGEGQQLLYRTDPSSRQRKRPTSTNPQLSDSNKNLVVSPVWLLYSKTDWPTDRRSLTQNSQSDSDSNIQCVGDT